jgi:hypothetical protein
MNMGLGCTVLICAGIAVAGLAGLLIIPFVGWLLALGAAGLVIWFMHGAVKGKRKIARQPELLWVEPGQLCYMADGVTEERVSVVPDSRLEIQWVGGSGSGKYVKLSLAMAPEKGRRERVLLAHGIHGTEAARAVAAWLTRRLQADLPVVQVEQGVEQLEAMNRWVKDPTKR